VVVSTRTIDEAGEIVEIIPESNIVFDQFRLTFSGNAQNFREVEILGPVVNAPLLSAISLLIRQALFFRGSGAPE
jgi:hypothetical protein